MLTRRHVLPPSLLGEMARHRLVQNARSRSNSKTASLYPECNQTCAVHAHEHTAQNQTNFHVNGWASGPCKLKKEGSHTRDSKPDKAEARQVANVEFAGFPSSCSLPS